MHVVTFATHDEGYILALRESCRCNNLELVELGRGERWMGFLHKVNIIRKYLRAIHPDTVVLVVDAYDVIILRSADEILACFDHLTHGQASERVVIGMENQNRSLVSWVWLQTQFGSCNNVTISAGNYIGTAESIDRMYGFIPYEALLSSSGDDQVFLNQACKKQYDQFHSMVVVDFHGWMFFNCHGRMGSPGHLRMDNLANRQTGIRPCVLHESTVCTIVCANSCHCPGRTDLDPYCRRLGLPLGSQREKLSLWHPSFYIKTNLILLCTTLLLLMIIVRCGRAAASSF